MDTPTPTARGASEEVLGSARSRRSGQRDHIVLATKVFAPMDDHDPNMRGNHRRHVIEQCEASLRRLQTDWIDLYQIHRPMPNIPIDETLRALDDLVRQGKVRYLGTSTFAAWQIMESLWVSKEYGLNRFVCEQPPYHLLDRRPERELIPMAQTYGLAPDPLVAAGRRLAHRQVPARRRARPRRALRRPDGAAAASSRMTRYWALMDVLRANRRGEELQRQPARPGLVRRPARHHQPHHRPAHDGATRGQPGLGQGEAERRGPEAAG